MKKRRFLKMVFIVAVAAICIVNAAPAVVAASESLTQPHKYWCLPHCGRETDMYISLTAMFDGKTCTDVWWDSSYSHWPNAFSFGSTASGYGYARGTYTIYSSLITQWASIAFDSQTRTIYLYN